MCTNFYLQDQFDALLNLFWTEYEFLVWRLNKPLTLFKGKEFLLFIKNIPSIILIMKDNVADDEHVRNIWEGLKLWSVITLFLVKTIITNTEKYKEELKDFKKDLNNYYAVGANTFLTQQVIGDR